MKNWTRVRPIRVGQEAGPVALDDAAEPPGQPLAKCEKQRGDPEQVRDQLHESSLWRVQKHHGARHAANNADGNQRNHHARGLRQAAPIREDARHRTRPDGDGVGGVGGNGKDSRKDERGKREEAATAGNRIHGAGQQGGQEEKDRVWQVHSLKVGTKPNYELSIIYYESETSWASADTAEVSIRSEFRIHNLV